MDGTNLRQTIWEFPYTNSDITSKECITKLLLLRI